jgi:hypothetical protein
MRRPSLGTVALLISLALAQQAPAKPRPSAQTLCKEIRKAVSAGQTLEQITAQFGTDARHVMKCMESRGKSHKAPKKGKSSGAKAVGHHTQTPSAVASNRGASPRATLHVK